MKIIWITPIGQFFLPQKKTSHVSPWKDQQKHHPFTTSTKAPTGRSVQLASTWMQIPPLYLPTTGGDDFIGFTNGVLFISFYKLRISTTGRIMISSVLCIPKFCKEETEEADTTPVCDYNPTKVVDLSENGAGFIGTIPKNRYEKINKT